MKLIKRVIPALCVLALATGVGCGNNNNDDNNGTANNGANNGTANNGANNGTANNGANNGTANNGANNGTANNGANNGAGGATYCQLECNTATDCGDATQFECTDNRCEFTGEVDGCTQDEECIATFSGWVTECQTDADCPGQVCIDIGDDAAGRCATAPGAVDCATLTLEDYVAEKFEDGTTVDVCANQGAQCHDDGYCFNPCTADSDCGDLRCNTDTGTCYCDDDSQCTAMGADTCHDNGSCGCGDETSCDALETAGQSFVCE